MKMIKWNPQKRGKSSSFMRCAATVFILTQIKDATISFNGQILQHDYILMKNLRKHYVVAIKPTNCEHFLFCTVHNKNNNSGTIIFNVSSALCTLNNCYYQRVGKIAMDE